MRIRLFSTVFSQTAVSLTVLLGGVPALAQADAIYECPGRNYTNMISAQEAATRGCKLSSKTQAVISVPGTRPVTQHATSSGSTVAPQTRQVATTPPAGATTRSPETRVDPSEQRARDSDARRILEAELRKEEDRFAALSRDFNGGEPERRGDERNFAKYQERVAEMKAAMTRKESDIGALRRELSKLP